MIFCDEVCSRLKTASLSVLISASLAQSHSSHAAAAHQEIVVGCDSKSNLVAKFDNATPFPLAVSRFTGIEGYAEAIPGFSSAGLAEPDKDFFPLDAQANVVFVFEGADAGAAVWNDHGSGLMRPGEAFKLGNPFFDSHPVWNIIVKGEAGKRYAYHLKEGVPVFRNERCPFRKQFSRPLIPLTTAAAFSSAPARLVCVWSAAVKRFVATNGWPNSSYRFATISFKLIKNAPSWRAASAAHLE